MTADFMSSEESGEEDVMIIKPLQWRSERVDKFFRQLDEKSNACKTAQAKRQRKARVTSVELSVRPQSAADSFPAWSFLEN